MVTLDQPAISEIPDPQPAEEPPLPRPAPSGVRMAYLLSRYPAVSHTFFLHEVLGLRARGLHIETASINPPDRPAEQLPPAEAAEAETTQYIKSTSKVGALGTLLLIALSRPDVVLHGLWTVFRMPGLTLHKRLQWLFYLAEALLVGRWMRGRALQHLHVHFGGPVASVGMLCSRAWRIPFSMTIHGPEELLNHEACHLQEKLEAATFVICISDFCRSQLMLLLPVEQWPKLHTRRLGVDPAVLTPSQRRTGSTEPQGPLHLVCTGRLVAAKGHRILLQALAHLAAQGVRMEATLIGSGPERPSLEAFARAHQLRVEFTGALSHADTLAHVCRADLFALSSFAEGIPVAFMEAMALAVPCVGTAVAGIPELIRNGRDGLLVAPSSVEELSCALQALAADPALRRRLGASGRERIVTHYNLPLNHERLAQLFTELIAPKPSTPAQHA